MEIRQLCFNEYESVIMIEKSVFPNEYWDDDTWAFILKNKNLRIALGLFTHEKLIGFILATTLNCNTIEEVNISNFAILKEYRNMGYGKILMLEIIKELSKYNFRYISAETRISNNNMKNIFKNFNFIEDKIIKGYYSNPKEDASHFILKLR